MQHVNNTSCILVCNNYCKVQCTQTTHYSNAIQLWNMVGKPVIDPIWNINGSIVHIHIGRTSVGPAISPAMSRFSGWKKYTFQYRLKLNKLSFRKLCRFTIGSFSGREWSNTYNDQGASVYNACVMICVTYVLDSVTFFKTSLYHIWWNMCYP